ncbi:hypothetical protein QYS49_25705 [Marivirga salinae]|uniref:Outer membrane protein beta-barrel domain-containing protein n=1 Tax=Marivirga salinarum TaxID=3059078 RepID=A0AA49J982_9BACT|nr:DUF6588 family protein [Marivirga sp. BDSF4-3]WKK75008.2 hypothetical protein QYS49_25705 [Marivirga sp. BDSF4-3]
MKRIFTIILTIFAIIANNNLNAQNQNFENVLNGGTADANLYLKEFMNPVAYSIGNGLANGWYNTAKPHKTLGFDLSFNVNLATIPDVAKSFEFLESDYSTLQIDGPATSASLPTFAGGETTTELLINGTTQTIVAPSGIEEQLGDYPGPLAIPTPTIQLGIGIIKNTDLIIRYTPEITAGDFSFQSFGFGVKHDFKQWIPGMKLLPFDLSALAGYNNISTTYQIDETAGQFAEFNASATTVQAIISKKLLFFTPYAGVGVNIVRSNFALNGTYVVEENGETIELTDPLGFDFDGSGGPRFTVGFRLKFLWALALNVDYTIQKYNTLSVGFGINVR